MPFVILPTNSASGGYNITNSLRFNSGSSDYLNRTPASAGSRTAWTWSSWVKRSELATGSAQVLFGAYLTGSDSGWLEFGFDSDNTANWTVQNVGGNSTSVYRDVSAWYHYLMNYDGTAGGLKLYINGSQVTISNTSSISGSLGINSASSHRIGRSPNTAVSRQFGGYMSDIYFIDGSTLTPTSFGETDEDTGIWKPKAYTGTYGTNGFYLQFKNSASLGTDSSGNGNNFTVNNLTSIDQTTDTPTNNFATLNPLNMGTRITLTEGNLQQVTSASTSTSCRVASTIAVSAGKWYCEYKAVSGTVHDVGIYSTSESVSNDYIGSTAKSYGYYTTGTKYNNGGSAYGASWTAGDIIGIAFDADNGTLTFYKNGTSQGTAFTSIPNDFYYFAQGDSTNATWTGQFNFGNPPYSGGSFTDSAGFGNFSYQPPANYFSLCTKNLATYG